MVVRPPDVLCLPPSIVSTHGSSWVAGGGVHDRVQQRPALLPAPLRSRDLAREHGVEVPAHLSNARSVQRRLAASKQASLEERTEQFQGRQDTHFVTLRRRD